MLRYSCPLFLLLFFSNLLNAQYFKLTGKVTNNKLEPLAFASIHVKELQSGTVSHEDGSYELQLEEGKYDLVISMIGYKNKVLTLVVNRNTTQHIILDPDESKDLSEVIVKGKMKDRAEEFIRNVIRHKDELQAASGAYSVDVYIRALQKDSFAIKAKKLQKDTSEQLREKREMAKMSLAEISLHYDQSTNGQIKEERLGVSRRGDPNGLFYLTITDGDFNLYNNLIKAKAVSSIPFISPVSYSGLIAYRFKTIKTEHRNKQKIYTISIKPRQVSNATVEGEITIADSSWVILSATFRLPDYHLPEYDFFEVDQKYDLIHDTAWMITRQSFTYYSKAGKGKRSGQTVAAYNNFQFNKNFPKGYFGNELSSTTDSAYKRDSSFWQQTRTEPLTAEEIRFIRYKDSAYNATHTKAYLDSLDRVINKITWKKIGFLGQTLHNHEKERTWELPTVWTLYQPLNFGGTRINPTADYYKTYKSRKNIYVRADISYGLRNKDVNGSISLNRMYNPFNRGFYHLSAEREFSAIYSGDAWINQLKRSNVYLNNQIGIGHGLELLNGLFFYTDFDIAFRRSVSDYKTGHLVDSLFGNILDDNRAIAFSPYNAVYGKLRLQYTPGQQYIREPREKVILGSKWPTFYTMWRKGIKELFNSKVDFDYLEFGIEQRVDLGTLGTSSYTIKTGNFPDKRDLRLVDYQFQRQGDPILFLNPNEQFQSLDSTFPVFKRFYQAHYIHEFNGFLINKIPCLATGL
ncbi:MAG: DUF5686 and carboxypeptidase regulatory-like domain-containing protein [Chitinophagaceae bacterium]